MKLAWPSLEYSLRGPATMSLKNLWGLNLKQGLLKRVPEINTSKCRLWEVINSHCLTLTCMWKHTGMLKFTAFWCLPLINHNVSKVCEKLLYQFWSLRNQCSMKCQNYDVKWNIETTFYNVLLITNFSTMKQTKKCLEFIHWLSLLDLFRVIYRTAPMTSLLFGLTSPDCRHPAALVFYHT